MTHMADAGRKHDIAGCVRILGEHVVALEPPDMLVLSLRGVLRPSHVTDYVAMRSELLSNQRYLLTLIDIRDVTEVDPQSRRPLAAIRDNRPQATAIVGGSFHIRVVVEMIANATRLFSRRKFSLRFFSTEPRARSWLSEMREKLSGL